MGIFGDIESATSGALNFVLSPLRSLLRRGLHTVAGWALDIFHLVGGAWDRMTDGAWSMWHGAADLAESVYHFGGRVVGVYLPDLLHWAARNINRVEGLARGFAVDLFTEIGRAEHLAGQLVDGALHFVQTNLIDPIENRLGQLENTIGAQIGPALDLLLHPGKLIEVLGSWVLDHVIDTLDALGGPVFRWFRRSAVHDAVTVAHEIEQLISAVV